MESDPIDLYIGTSKSSSKTTQTSSTAQSSTLNAGGDITIVASGAGQDSDINIIGSQVKSNDDVTLKADDKITLQAAQNTNTLDGKNKSSSASLGVSFGSNGFAVTASASQGKGKTTGNGTSWTETIIQSGNQDGDKVTLESGTDTTIKGAQVTGNQVVANVGTSGSGNLSIESLQDTDQYKDKQKSAGISVSIPIGAGGYGGSISASSSKTKSNYASVNEQSGIMAGDGGFQVNVNGNTNLTGAVISSTDKAIQDNKNTLSTQTLTTSNIENSAEFSAKGLSVSAGVGLNQQPDGTGYKNSPTASAGSANLSDDSSSVTVSGISSGLVNITDNTTQQIKAGKDNATTLAMLNRDVQTQFSTDAQGNTSAMAVDSQGNNLAGTLTQIFDKEQVQRELNAQIQITQAFSQVAPKAVGDFAGNKVKELTAQGNKEEAKKWDEGGIYRIALHTALGGLLTGDLSGAAGAGVVASAAPLLNDLQSKVTEALQNAGLGEQGANTISQALAELTSLGIGSAIGGTVGATTALVVDTNNRQLHVREIDLAKKYAKALKDAAAKNGEIITEEEAIARIERQLLRWVNAATNTYDEGKQDQLVTSIIGMSGKDTTTGFTWDYRNYSTQHAAEYNDSSINSQNISLYSNKLLDTNYGLTPQQIEAKNNAAGAPLAKLGLLGLGILTGAEVGAVLVRAAPEIAAKIGVSVEACLANLPLCANQAGIFASEVAAGDALGGAGLTIGAGAMGKAITQAGADARLSAKAAGLSSDAINAAEDLAITKALLQLETTSGGHFVSRHGEQLTDQQLIDRAVRGILPDMPNATPERTLRDATRWASNSDMSDAIMQAEKMYLANPSFYKDGVVKFDMGRIVGDGYTKGTAQHMGASMVEVRFNTTIGKPYTAYPVIDPKLQLVR